MARAGILLSGLIVICAEIFAQNVYKKPHESGVNLGILQDAETELASRRPDCDSIIDNLQIEIKKYTTQFVEDKRILDERRRENIDFHKLDKNTIRLLTLARRNEYGKIQFLGESPLMYRLHRALGRCYAIQKDNYRALSEYSMAFRYTSFEQPWREPAARTPAELLEAKAKKELELREERYMLMRKSFAGADRLKEESDANIARAGRRFSEALEEYWKLKIETTQAWRRIDAYIARNARGDRSVSPADARAEYRTLKTRLEGVLGVLEGIRIGPYRSYHKAKQKEDGELAFRMAILIKGLEEKNKKLSRILNRSSYSRGVGSSVLEEKTRFGKFIGYGIFLEMANKLDPDNTRYLSLLAEEYRNSRHNKRAIIFEKRYIELSVKQTPIPAELSEHYLRLGGLFTDTRNYIAAAGAYEEFLKRETDANKKNKISLQLANIYFRHTGNFGGARVLYEDFVARGRARDLSGLDYKTRATHHALRYRVLRKLASIARRDLRSDREKKYLADARQEFNNLEADYKKSIEAENEILIKINDLKKALLGREDDRLQTRYYLLLRQDLPVIQQRTGFLRTRLNALNLPGVLERQAFLALRERRFNDALTRYREILKRGTGEQATRARKNIQLINRTLNDGILRRPILPPSFER